MSLVAWYPLIKDGNNQGLDGINLTTVGSVTYTAGKLGNAATFTNNTGIRFRRANFTEQTGWSVCAWVKCDSATSVVQWCFNNGRDSNNDGWHCYFSAAGTTLYLRIGSSTWSQTSTLGTWYHVCMTIDDSSKYVFYVNGTQVSTGTVATLPDYTESGGLMAIGGFAYEGGNIYPLSGQVQDFRYFNHVLSKREVKEISKGLMTHLPLSWGGNPNILPGTPLATNPTENSSYWGKEVFVRSITATTESFLYSGRSDVVSQSTKYTFSAWVWVNEYVSSVEFFWLSTNTTNKKTGTNWDSVTVTSTLHPTPNTWNYMTWTFTTKADDYTGFIRIDNNGSTVSGTAATLKIVNMKLEKGEQATPYIPHKNDTIYSVSGYGDKFIQDCSGYNRTVIKTGTGMSTSTDSPRGTGTNWNGSGKIVVSDGMPIGTQSSFTINTWLRTTTGATLIRYNDVYGFTLNSGDGTSIYTRCELEQVSGNNIHWWGIGTSQYQFAGSMPVTPGTWTMVTLVSDGTKFYTYKNGVLHNTLTPASDKLGWQTLGSITVGDQNAGNVYYDQADFRVYATCLSADDIKALYQIPAEIDKSGNMYCTNLVEV